MREFVKVSPSVWNSRKFWSLPDDLARYAYLYVLTNEHINSAGCYKLSIGYICGDLKWEPEVARKAIERLSIAGLVDYDEGENTILILNWGAFNAPTNPKHAIGLLTQLDQQGSHRLKTICFHSVLDSLRARGFDRDAPLRKAIDFFLKRYPKAIATETRPERETEMERETRLDQTETEIRACARTPLRAAALTGGGEAASGETENRLEASLARLEAARHAAGKSLRS